MVQLQTLPPNMGPQRFPAGGGGDEGGKVGGGGGLGLQSVCPSSQMPATSGWHHGGESVVSQLVASAGVASFR